MTVTWCTDVVSSPLCTTHARTHAQLELEQVWCVCVRAFLNEWGLYIYSVLTLFAHSSIRDSLIADSVLDGGCNVCVCLSSWDLDSAWILKSGLCLKIRTSCVRMLGELASRTRNIIIGRPRHSFVGVRTYVWWINGRGPKYLVQCIMRARDFNTKFSEKCLKWNLLVIAYRKLPKAGKISRFALCTYYVRARTNQVHIWLHDCS